MKISEDRIKHALAQVIDPDLDKDLVSLNMISDIHSTDTIISFTLVLTTPACPLKNELKQACIDSIHNNIGKEYEVRVKFSSKVAEAKKNKSILPGVKNIIAVASGKGGVGKSTVAANLALGLAKTGAKTGLLDADIYGPSIPIMYQVETMRPYVKEQNGKNVIIPLEKYEVKLLSIGFFVDQGKALVWRGPMASNALKQLITDADWGELDYLVIDMPPGTGDIQLTLVQEVPVTGIIIVSTPQKVALADAEKGIEMFRNKSINVPVLGMVENMSYFTPPELPDNKYYIFGKDGTKQLAEKHKIRILGEIPIVEEIRECGDIGTPAVMNSSTPSAKAFMEMSKNIAQAVSIHNIMTGNR